MNRVRYLLLASICLTMLGLASCGGSSSSPAKKKPTPTATSTPTATPTASAAQKSGASAAFRAAGIL